MYEVIKNLNKQFEWQPEIVNAGRLKKYDKFIVVGMGGSHMAADILKSWHPELPVKIHHDYGLPQISGEELAASLIVFCSRSGNTEETLDGFMEAGKMKLDRAVIAAGGKLLQLAEKEKLPYVPVSDARLQARSSQGLVLKALLKLMNREDLLKETGELAKLLRPETFEDEGKALAAKLGGAVPVIYSSVRNFSLSSDWKIKFNETGKIPAFFNIFSELNHNEMTGFDVTKSTRKLSKGLCFVILKDSEDDPRIIKRMEVVEKMYKERGFRVESVPLSGNGRLLRIFSSLVLADWTAYYTSMIYGTEPEQVPMVEEFKKLIV